jgi:hypothetical protein
MAMGRLVLKHDQELRIDLFSNSWPQGTSKTICLRAYQLPSGSITREMKMGGKGGSKAFQQQANQSGEWHGHQEQDIRLDFETRIDVWSHLGCKIHRIKGVGHAESRVHVHHSVLFLVEGEQQQKMMYRLGSTGSL